MHSCDGCSACCKVMKIEALDKPAHVWCEHCQIGSGCRIYDARPEACRFYECVWLKTQRLDKPMLLALRPDKSRVVIGTTNHGEDVVLYVSPDRPEAWKSGEFRKLLAEFKARRITVLLSCGDRLEHL